MKTNYKKIISSFYSLSSYICYYTFLKTKIFSGMPVRLIIIYVFLFTGVFTGISMRNKVQYGIINMIGLVLSILSIVGFTWGFMSKIIG